MKKGLGQYAKEWQGNAEADPLWVILTDPRYYGGKWDSAAFFATGEEEIARVFQFMESASISAPSGSFLDFGCGVGRVSRALRQRFQHGFGVDISPKMIELARTYVEGVEFFVSQTDSLSAFEDRSVDFVYSHIVLQHIPNEYQQRYIDEFLRILRPGGLAVIQIPIDLINPKEIEVTAVHRLKQTVKRSLPMLVTLKRKLLSPKGPHHEFRYEMHALPDEAVRSIINRRGYVLEAAPATNSCEPDHNGKVEFYELDERRKALKQSGTCNRYLSCMYFVRRPPAN
jgi:SAM-dependent methyltransferase